MSRIIDYNKGYLSVKSDSQLIKFKDARSKARIYI